MIEGRGCAGVRVRVLCAAATIQAGGGVQDLVHASLQDKKFMKMIRNELAEMSALGVVWRVSTLVGLAGWVGLD